MAHQNVSTPPDAFLDTVEGEISFFRSTMQTRPVGIHRHFHVMTIRNAVQKETGQTITTDDIWRKLRSCYNLDALEGLEADGYDSPRLKKSPLPPTRTNSPSPSQNLSGHPFFKHEYTLPYDETFESLISVRRTKGTPSPGSSPENSPPPTRASHGTRSNDKRGKTKLDMAGLVGGDSDSSALTQDSGDEGPTPIESVVTGTDGGGTDYAEDEDVEMHDASPEPSTTTKQTRGKVGKGSKKAGTPVGKARPPPPKGGIKKKKK